MTMETETYREIKGLKNGTFYSFTLKQYGGSTFGYEIIFSIEKIRGIVLKQLWTDYLFKISIGSDKVTLIEEAD